MAPASCLILLAIFATSTLATPVAQRQNDEPNLSDALPVVNLRNDGSPSTQSPFDLLEPARLTTREVSSQPQNEQDRETTATTELGEATTETTTSKPEISTVASTDVTETTTSTDFELDSTTNTATEDAIDSQKISATTTTTAAPSPSTERSIEVDKPATTLAPIEETTMNPSIGSTSPLITERPTTEESPEPEVTASQLDIQSDNDIPVEATTTTAEAPVTTTTITTSTTAPEAQSLSTTQAPVETDASSTQAPASPQTEALGLNTEILSVSTEKNDGSSRGEKVDGKAPCNHSRTHESEELHKVLREEITYKNGTIKGKFTYSRREHGDEKTSTHHYHIDPHGASQLVIPPQVPSLIAQHHSTSLVVPGYLLPNSTDSATIGNSNVVLAPARLNSSNTGIQQQQHHHHFHHHQFNHQTPAHGHLHTLKEHLLLRSPLKFLLNNHNVRQEQQ